MACQTVSQASQQNLARPEGTGSPQWAQSGSGTRSASAHMAAGRARGGRREERRRAPPGDEESQRQDDRGGQHGEAAAQRAGEARGRRSQADQDGERASQKTAITAAPAAALPVPAAVAVKAHSHPQGRRAESRPRAPARAHAGKERRRTRAAPKARVMAAGAWSGRARPSAASSACVPHATSSAPDSSAAPWPTPASAAVHAKAPPNAPAMAPRAA
jgi:hypothetical protein